MENADKAKQIRFIDSGYDFLFAVPDGANIIITRADGEKLTRPCKFLDEYHTQIGSSIYHICEFAEKMERVGAKYAPEEPLRELPNFCYAVLPSSGELIRVKNGEQGYYPDYHSSADAESNREKADQLNGGLLITRGQAAAMLHGSLFGWDTPGADPANYMFDGSPLRQGAVSDERSEPVMDRYDRAFAERMKRNYPAGTKIVLDSMDDPYRDMPTGLKGIVTGVDDMGTIFCSWENGSTLGIVPGVDSFHKDLTPDAAPPEPDAGQDLER